MIKQVDVFIDVFEPKFPGCTADFSFDWSSGHAAYSEDALVLSNFNTKYGGKPGCSAYKVREKTVILEDYGAK